MRKRNKSFGSDLFVDEIREDLISNPLRKEFGGESISE